MTEVTQEQAAVQLSLQDIAMAIQVIDVCSKRGAFEGAEMEPIGALRNRVVAFLEANKPPAEEGEGVDPEGREQPQPEEA
tara:strand:+ start:1064 stop:1303 length:240 start_codon:yes stop_codon:yes gene_type:complete